MIRRVQIEPSADSSVIETVPQNGVEKETSYLYRRTHRSGNTRRICRNQSDGDTQTDAAALLITAAEGKKKTSHFFEQSNLRADI